ncbi:MAG TPA: hypothetical protein VF407_20705 [Polyangiaceae bacterium]
MRFRWGWVAVFGVMVGLGACSSSSGGDSSFPESDASTPVDSGLPVCPSSVVLGAGDTQTNEYAGGSCADEGTPSPCRYSPGAGSGCGQSFDNGTQFTCTCDGAKWTCTITGGGLGNPCDAATDDAAIEDAATSVDAADAADD